MRDAVVTRNSCRRTRSDPIKNFREASRSGRSVEKHFFLGATGRRVSRVYRMLSVIKFLLLQTNQLKYFIKFFRRERASEEKFLKYCIDSNIHKLFRKERASVEKFFNVCVAWER